MKEEFRKDILAKFILIFLVVIACISGFLWYSSANNHQKKELEKTIASMESDTDFYVTAKENYTVDEVVKEIEESNIDILEKTKSEKAKIEASLQRVYSQTKTKEAYDSLEKDIQKNLGESFSEILVKLAKPTLSQSGKGTFTYDEMTDSKIAFGKYDISTQSMQCYVLVDWVSPTLDATSSGIKTESKQTKIKGQDFFILDYGLKEDSLKVLDYQHLVDSEVDKK